MATASSLHTARGAGRPDSGAAGAHLSELFARHGATVLGLCRVLLRHREEAEDAVQATFLSAYRSLLNGVEPRHPAAWLATIARNECWGRIRQRMREPLGVEHEPESRLPDPVAAAAANLDLAELWRAIGELPRQQRRALLLREFSGLSYGELAEALAVSEPAVESLLFRARRELKLRLRPAYTSITGLAPLAAIREALDRTIGGMPDPAATGALAKIAAAPFVAKLAAGAAAAVVIGGGTVAAVDLHAPPPLRERRADPVAAEVSRPRAAAATPQLVRVRLTPVASASRIGSGREAAIRGGAPRAVPVSRVGPAPVRAPGGGGPTVAESADPGSSTPTGASPAPGSEPSTPAPAPAPTPATEPGPSTSSGGGDHSGSSEGDGGHGGGSGGGGSDSGSGSGEGGSDSGSGSGSGSDSDDPAGTDDGMSGSGGSGSAGGGSGESSGSDRSGDSSGQGGDDDGGEDGRSDGGGGKD